MKITDFYAKTRFAPLHRAAALGGIFAASILSLPWNALGMIAPIAINNKIAILGSMASPTTSKASSPQTANALAGNRFAKEIYLAIRSDGATGSGTSNDPLDVSTAKKFDSFMRRAGTNVCIHLAPGTYQTSGWAATANRGPTGFQTRAGQQFEGSGMGLTIIQYASSNVARTGGTMFYSDGADCSGFSMKNLTLDINYAGVGEKSTNAYSGIGLSGSHILIDHVEVINGAGTAGGSAEQFCILVTGGASGYDNVISNCVTHQFAITGTNACTNGSDVGGNFSRLINDYDDGACHAFTSAAGKDIIIDGCTSTLNDSNGFYEDSDDLKGLVVSHCSLSGRIPIQFNLMPGKVATDVRIESNSFTSNNSGAGSNSAIVLNNGQGSNGLRIVGNILTYVGTLGATRCALVQNNGPTSYTGIFCEDNKCPALCGGLISNLVNSANVIGWNSVNGSWVNYAGSTAGTSSSKPPDSTAPHAQATPTAAPVTSK